MPILDPLVSKPKFDMAVRDLREVERQYRKVWRMREPQFPLIFLDILSVHGRPLFTLRLDMQDWDFLPPYATIVDKGSDEPLPSKRVPAAADMSDGSKGHFVGVNRGRQGAFCCPGFLDYHRWTPEDPWERVRNTDRGTIVWIVEQACNMIDRPRLPGGARGGRRKGGKKARRRDRVAAGIARGRGHEAPRAGRAGKGRYGEGAEGAPGLRGKRGTPAVRLPRGVFEKTIAGLREFGKRGLERHALWVGREEGGTFAVKEVVFPEQQNTGFSYEVSDEEMFRVCRDAGRQGMAVMCQVHTHPGRAFHSPIDSEGSALALPGSLSVVVPDYAEGNAGEPSKWAAYVFDGSTWRRLRPKEVRRAFRAVAR